MIIAVLYGAVLGYSLYRAGDQLGIVWRTFR